MTSPMTLMVSAAIDAGAIQRDAFNSQILTIEDKSGGIGTPDLVSYVDRESERLIRETLKDYNVVGEEHGGTTSNDYILVDPLDGTKNFLCGVEHFAVCITHIRDQQVVGAVVYDPMRDRLFQADNTGAYLNGTSITVRNNDMRTTYFVSEENLADNDALKRISAVAKSFAGIRKFGSTALDLALMASGQSCALVATGLKPWDFLGAAFIYTQAGGIISDINGQNIKTSSTSLIAANQGIHSNLVNALRADNVHAADNLSRQSTSTFRQVKP